MFVKLITVKMLIVTFIIGPQDSYGNMHEEDDPNYELELANAKTYKHPRCFPSTTPGCVVSVNPSPGIDIMRWLYVPTTRACAYVYMPGNNTCEEVNSFPLNLKECEDLCGEPCIITYASKLSEPGICMMNCHITPPLGARKPCPKNAKCCPRNYKYPTTTPVPVMTKKP